MRIYDFRLYKTTALLIKGDFRSLSGSQWQTQWSGRCRGNIGFRTHLCLRPIDSDVLNRLNLKLSIKPECKAIAPRSTFTEAFLCESAREMR